MATFLLAGASAQAGVRIKDIADWAGARSNHLVGFGLVVGLDNTGSRSSITQQVAVDMLNSQEVCAELLKRDILVDWRPKAGVRMSPHFYNKDEEIDVAFAAAEEILARIPAAAAR